MPETRLRHSLEELHGELERTEEFDEESRRLLVEVLDDIREVLERSGSDEDDSLLGRLRELTREFEESHPSLAAAANRVMNALSHLGI